MVIHKTIYFFQSTVAFNNYMFYHNKLICIHFKAAYQNSLSTHFDALFILF